MTNTDDEAANSAKQAEGDAVARRAVITADALIQQIRDTADKLAADESSRGDLKILSRSLRELRYAFKVFAPYRHRRKVTVFGSARTPEDAPSFQAALEFGKKIAEKNWLVITGAASGIMEAGHLGAGRENSMGLNIMLPFEQDANEVILGDEKLVHMKYFFTRKLMFVKECDAVVCFAGGFGTLDEAFEVLTLLQTGKREMCPVVLVDEPGGYYWKRFHEFMLDPLLKQRLISPEDLAIYKVTDNCDEAIEETLGFYRNYHSMRFVRDKLVLRIQEAPSPELFEQIQTEFQDILVRGQFKLSDPLPHESDQPDLAPLPRLVFEFNRRSLGRFRMLIDCLNQQSIEPALREFPEP
ncbi:LOG family protein [Blastopirellula retiformator]|uniref:AMP nucleosidase n=1 Tax=Blastopirellula retiformator TaxID=2527970 RepID=A0A5C5VMJ3_9BACT|nr:LOG family protein [Blastopirellula retiformator]TWT39105.1 putative lysine decarboxylase [Blastopirellula retiformator]